MKEEEIKIIFGEKTGRFSEEIEKHTKNLELSKIEKIKENSIEIS